LLSVFKSAAWARFFCLRCFLATSIAWIYLFLTSAFHLKPHAADVLFNSSPTSSNAFNCVLPSLIWRNTVSANSKSSSCDHASCLTFAIIYHSILMAVIVSYYFSIISSYSLYYDRQYSDLYLIR